MSNRISSGIKITSEEEGLSVFCSSLLIGFIFVIYPLQTMGITKHILVRAVFFTVGYCRRMDSWA